MKLTSILMSGALVLASPTLWAAGLVVTPAAISNSYSGLITLQVTGLTNGEPVTLEKYHDVNGNGVLNPGETMLQSFRVTDGQVSSIGGVRNPNVPGDEDGTANGQMTATVSQLSASELNRAVGTFLYRVSSPTARFSPVVQAFAITNTAHLQTISGNVAGGANALVVQLLAAAGDGEYVAGVFADAAGNYTLRSAPGSFQLFALTSGSLADFSAAPTVVVTSGANVTQNLSLVASTRTISGRLRDAATGDGLPGVTFFVGGTNDQFAVGFTDNQGNFSIGVTSGEWVMEPNGLDLALLGCLGPNPEVVAVTTAGNVTGLNIDVTQATALFFGSVRDAQSIALSGVEVFTKENFTQQEAFGFTDLAGNFAVGAQPGSWHIGPSSEPLAARGLFSQSTNATLAGGQAIRIDFIARAFTARLQGRVVSIGGAPVGDIGLVAFQQTGSSQFTRTAADGTFDLGVEGGNWSLGLETEEARQRGLIGPSLLLTVTDGINITNINYVVHDTTALISGLVRNNTGMPLVDVNVSASLSLNGTNYNVNSRTDAGGNYSFGVFNGTWLISLDCQPLSQSGYQCPGFQSTNVSGANVAVNFTVQPIPPLQIVTTNLPDGRVGIPYVTQLTASGGVQPYTWSHAPGSLPLPPGFSLFSNGQFSGTPATAGSFSFTVRVTAGASHADANLTLTVVSVSVLQIATQSLPPGAIGVLYTQQLLASGGTPPYSWGFAPASSPLPPGLSLAADGVLSGTPTVPGVSNFNVRVTDSLNNIDDQPLSLLVSAPLPAVWQYRAFMSTPRTGPGAAVIDGKLYVVGGFSGPAIGNLEEYDPVSGAWTTRAPMPTPRGRVAVGVINGLLYVAGGFGGENKLEIYNPVSNTWSNGSPMSINRNGAAAGVINGRLYVVGGTANALQTLEEYNPASNTWTSRAPMPTPRYLLGAGVISGELYAVGGANAVTGGPGLGTLEVYNRVTDTWTNLASMPTPRSDLAATTMNGRLYAAGGFSTTQRQLEAFDPVANNWTSEPAMLTARGDLALAAVGNKLFAVGGTLAPGQASLSMLEQFSSPGSDRIVARVVKSDATTQAAGLGAGVPSPANFNRMDAGDVSGLTFQSAQVGTGGSSVGLPVGAPTGTQIINVAPANGQNGFFKATFVLPEGFLGAQLSFAANADFYGRGFLNGQAFSTSMSVDNAGRVTQSGNAQFAVKNPDWFRPGTNEVLLSDANYDGGASGAGFYGIVTFVPVPVMNQLEQPAAGQFQFRVGGTTNETYSVQASTNLTTWTTLFTTNGAAGSFNYTDSAASTPDRYYRVLVSP